MNLVKDYWTNHDKENFIKYMESLSRSDKIAWSTNILQTPSMVLSIKTADALNIVEKIMQGNYQSFLDLEITNYYETIAIYGMILSRIDDLDLFLKYLNRYLDYMDCWAHCDLLSFKYLDERKDLYFKLSNQYLHDDRVMVRRLGLYILFKYVKDVNTLKTIFESILLLYDELEYYVIMMGGWLLSECIILHKGETLSFLRINVVNKKIQNKAIQKCRESNRLTKEQKEELLVYKIK